MFLDANWLGETKVFISSTLEDPTRIFRQKIINATKTLGLKVIEFQGDDFPYSDSERISVINDTINAVKSTDLFVLIIGTRYGTLTDNGKSVVHREFEEAVSSNIPIMVFIQERVWEDYCRGLHNADSFENRQHVEFIKQVSTIKVKPFKDDDQAAIHIKTQLNNYLGALLRFTRKATWLWNETDTRNAEKEALEIWIVTPNFYWDFEDAEFRRIVTDNIVKRGCIYRYIYPNTDINTLRVQEMLRLYQLEADAESSGQVNISQRVYYLPVPEKDFFWSTEQVLYNPFKLNESAIMVDIMDVRDRTLKFNIVFGRDKLIAFRNKFITFWNDKIDDVSKRIQV